MYQRHGSAVLAYIRRRVSSQEVEDVFSQTFLIAWRRFGQVPKDPLPWLLQVARRVLANNHRSEKRRGALQDRIILNQRPIPGASDDLAESTATARTMIDAIRRLPERDREALMLVAWEDLTTIQAARVMDCSPATFAVRLHRARIRLRKELGHAGHSRERGLNDIQPIEEA